VAEISHPVIHHTHTHRHRHTDTHTHTHTHRHTHQSCSVHWSLQQIMIKKCSEWHKLPRCRPPSLPRGVGWPKFNQLQMVTTFTYRPSLVKIDARNLELSW